MRRVLFPFTFSIIITVFISCIMPVKKAFSHDIFVIAFFFFFKLVHSVHRVKGCCSLFYC